MIECRGVFARAGSFELRDISLVVPEGSHAIMSGPTASGKTTLLETIAGGVRPSRGSVLIGGVNVTDVEPELRQVGLVHQHGYLFPHLTVRENIGYGADDEGMVDELVTRFDIPALITRSVRSLSGGERQIVALCRALAARPLALLLDEPFSALDRDRRGHVSEEFGKLQREWNTTVLHVTHDEAEASALARMRFAMNDGTLRGG